MLVRIHLKQKQTTMRRMLMNIIKIQQRIRMEKMMQDRTRKMLLAGMAN
jgi:hypothetical protein